MTISEIFELIKSEWQYFLGPVSLVGIITALFRFYFKKRKEKREFNEEHWRLIKPAKKILKKDFNVANYNKLLKRPSESEIRKAVLENKKKCPNNWRQ